MRVVLASSRVPEPPLTFCFGNVFALDTSSSWKNLNSRQHEPKRKVRRPGQGTVLRAAAEWRCGMFVNCYNGYGQCLFAVNVKEGVEPEELGDHIYDEHDLVDYWKVTEQPEGAVVRY